MNNNVLTGKWKQIRGQTKVWWGVLTRDDLKKVDGKFDKLIGRIQEKYGAARQHADEANIKRQNDRL